MKFLLLVLYKHQVLALLDRESSVDIQPIHGENDWYSVPDGKALKGAIKDLQARLEEDGKGDLQVNLIYDLASKDLLHSWPWGSDDQWCWQWLSWEILVMRTGLDQIKEYSVTFVRDTLLRGVREIMGGSNDDDSLPVMDLVIEGKANDSRERIAILQQENLMLRSRLQNHPTISSEQLVAYLPGLYQHVYSELSGSDLALLAGRVEPFQIPSPYQEPSEDALHTIQRKFLSLPLEEQKKIIQLAQSAPRRLKPRPNMLSIIRNLDE